MIKELTEWLETNKICHVVIDNEVVEIFDFGKLFLADLSGVESIFRGNKEKLEFNLMENPGVLMEEGIYHVAFPFGRNWYYYDLREEFRFNILKYIGKRKPVSCGIPFVNLGAHTPYELLNGSGDISLWVKKARLLGHTAIGICDKNTLAATLTLQKECLKAGLQHVFGYSFTIEHLGEKIEAKIYCQTGQGLKNLLRIHKSIMVDSETNVIGIQELIKHATGNVLVLGKMSSYWMKDNPAVLVMLKNAFDEIYYQVDLSEYKADRIDAQVLMAAKYFFDHFYHKDIDHFIVEPVLICDNYYLDKDDAKNKIILNKIATGAAHEQSDDQYFKDTDEHYNTIRAVFPPEKWNVEKLFEHMCSNTVKIARRSTARYETGKMYMPRYIMTETEKNKYGDSHTMFLSLLDEGIQRLCPPEKKEEYRKRLAYEIYILESTDNIDYMLIQYDTVNWARKNGIMVGCGRGSAGGCLALYLLGITLVDPVKYDLLFERFLLPERAGLYSAPVTMILDKITSTRFFEIELENGKTLNMDIDAQLLVQRGNSEIIVYADQLLPEDRIIFDNKDLIFSIS